MIGHLFGDLLFVNEEHSLGVVEVEISHKDGREGYVISGAQICHPCYIVKGGKHDGIGQFPFNFSHHVRYLTVDCFTHNFLIMNEELVFGTFGAIGINIIELGKIIIELDSVVGELLLEALCIAHRKSHTINCHSLTCVHFFCHPVDKVYRVRTVFLHHLEA